jgi:hypothetical protein
MFYCVTAELFIMKNDLLSGKVDFFLLEQVKCVTSERIKLAMRV